MPIIITHIPALGRNSIRGGSSVSRSSSPGDPWIMFNATRLRRHTQHIFFPPITSSGPRLPSPQTAEPTAYERQKWRQQLLIYCNSLVWLLRRKRGVKREKLRCFPTNEWMNVNVSLFTLKSNQPRCQRLNVPVVANLMNHSEDQLYRPHIGETHSSLSKTDSTQVESKDAINVSTLTIIQAVLHLITSSLKLTQPDVHHLHHKKQIYTANCMNACSAHPNFCRC